MFQRLRLTIDQPDAKQSHLLWRVFAQKREKDKFDFPDFSPAGRLPKRLTQALGGLQDTAAVCAVKLSD
jgi:hypothetical protein